MSASCVHSNSLDHCSNHSLLSLSSSYSLHQGRDRRARTHSLEMNLNPEASLPTVEEGERLDVAPTNTVNGSLNVPTDRDIATSSASSTIAPVSVPPSPRPESTPSLSSRVSLKRSNNDTPTAGPSRQPLSMVQSQASQKAPLALNKFILYENKARFYVVASNTSDSRHKILKIDRTSQEILNVHEDEMTYNGKQMSGILKMLEDGNRGSGGLGKARVIFGIVGS